MSDKHLLAVGVVRVQLQRPLVHGDGLLALTEDRQGLAEAGAPLSIARSFSGSQLLFDAAIPVRGITADTPRNGPRVRIGTTYAGNVIVSVKVPEGIAVLGTVRIASYVAVGDGGSAAV